MGKPYWGFNNLLTQSSTTLSARTESTAYPVSNLSKHRLWPGYRNADKKLVLNGTDEYAYIPSGSESAFRITSDFTMESLIYLDSAGVGTARRLLDKIDSNSGYLVLINSSEQIHVFINGLTPDGDTASIVDTGDPLAVDIWYWIKVVYDASAQEVSIYINGEETCRVNNTTQTGGTLTGAIPSSITSNTLRLTIGASSAATQLFEGKISYIGIETSERDNGVHLNPVNCAGYWGFEDSDLTDSSGHGRDLTGSGIDSTNYSACTAYQWIYIDHDITSPIYLMLDRRHNLSTGAKVRFLRGSSLYSGPYADPYTGSNYSNYTATVVAGQPVVIALPSAPPSMSATLIEFNDPGNPDGYIEIPYIYLGSKTGMQRSYLRGYKHGQPNLGKVIADCGGGYTGYMTSEKLWNANLKFRCNSFDSSTLQSVLDVARQMRPVVFCEDTDDETGTTRLVYLPEAMKVESQHIITTSNFVDIAMQEAGGGV